MTALAGFAVADAFFAQPQRGAGIRSLRDRHRYRLTYCRHLDPAAQHGLLQGHGNFDMDVVILAAKERMRLDMQFDIGVARRPAAIARHSLFFQPQHLPILGSFGHGHLQGLALWQA